MADEQNNQDMPAECMFDITKPPEQVEFLGFIDGLVGSGNNLSGLFEWTCSACGTSNHDAALIEPNQSFLAEWSCNHCDHAMLVRFRARPIADWIAQHALAITGRALCGLAEKGGASDQPDAPRTQSPRSSQKLFACIVVPLLGILIAVASTDLVRLHASSAYSLGAPDSQSMASYSWLGGYWICENPNDTICFVYMNPAEHCGAYTRPSRDDHPGEIVRFEIVQAETTNNRLVLRELNASPGTDGPLAILRITRSENSLVRITTNRGESTLATYYRSNRRPQ